MPPWRVLVWVKTIELVMQLRPRALARVLFMRDKAIRRAHMWYYRMGRRVWPHEVLGFLFRDKRTANGPTLAEFWGQPQDSEEESMLPRRPAASPELFTIEPLPAPGVERRLPLIAR